LAINNSRSEIKTFIFCSLFGAAAEIFAIMFGAWNYKNTNILHIPAWLALLWGIASIFMVRVYLFFNE